MNLRIEILGSKPQLFQVNPNNSVLDVINMIISKNKLKEQNQNLGLFLNGIELKKETKIQSQIKSTQEILQLKKIVEVQQLQGIKLCYNNGIKIAYVYLDDLNNVLYDQAEKQFFLSKDSFKLIFKNQILEKQISLKQNQINANSNIEVKMLNELKQPKQLINLNLIYQKENKMLPIDIDCRVFELEEQAKSLFKIKQDICIFNNNKVLLKDQKLIEADLNSNQRLLILLKNQYERSLTYINIYIEYNNKQFQMEVSTNTEISEIIDLLKTQNNYTNIDLMMNSQILPINQTISQLNIKDDSILMVIPKQNNILVLDLIIGQKTERMEIEKETIIQELISLIESNFQLQNIEITLLNGQRLHKSQSFKQQNIQSGTQLIVQCINPQQNRQQIANELNIKIQVSVQIQQKIYQFEICNNQLIKDLEKLIRTQLNCQHKIQLVYQNRILNQQNTFAQEGVPNESLLVCNFLMDKIEEKIKIIEKPVSSDPLVKIIIIFQNQQKDKVLKGNTLVEILITSIKSQFSIDQDIYLTYQGKILNPQQTLKENEIKENSQITVHLNNLQLFIKYKDIKYNLKVRLDTFIQELMLQIKKDINIENDFDILINGTKMNPNQQLKDLKLQNQECLEIQEKQKQMFKDQLNQQNQQNYQQGYQQINQSQNNQINQQIQSKQYQQLNEQIQQQQQSQPFKTNTIVIKEVEKKSNQKNQKDQPLIQIIGEKIDAKIYFQWETKISELIDYIKNEFKLKDQIKLIHQGKTLQLDQNLEEIQVKDNDSIFIKQNNSY